jgi:hypothetical protein
MKRIRFLVAAAFALAGSLGDAAELSTPTIVAEIEAGNRIHAAKIQSGRGVAAVKYMRHLSSPRRPKLQGGVIRRSGHGEAGAGNTDAPAYDLKPQTQTPAVQSRTITRSETISFAFRAGQMRWDTENVAIRRDQIETRGATIRRVFLGNRLIEYRPETDRATTRSVPRGDLQAMRGVEPFDPLHYGVKFFGDRLADLVRQSANRTSITVERDAGRHLYVLSIAPVEQEGRTRRLWIDPARGYTIAKYQALDKEGFASVVMRCAFTGHEGDIWVPASVEHETFDPKTKTLLSQRRITFSKFTPNVKIDDAVFTLTGMGVTKNTLLPGRRNWRDRTPRK